MITDELKERLKKVYELAKNGGTEGEKQAAQRAIDRLLSKYNLEGIDLESLELSQYSVKYSTDMDTWLFGRIVKMFISDNLIDVCQYTGTIKEICFTSTYINYITVSSAYEYFRRHMKAQWTKFCLPNLKRCRSTKSRNKRREELKGLFFSKYVIASNLYQPKEITAVSWDDMTAKEQRDRMKLQQVEGGKFNRQMTSGLLLNQ